jgi:outer membrane immunogenic protein
MKRLLLMGVAVAALAATVSANAADIPPRAPVYKAPVIAPVVFSWTGFYAGVNVGYGWGRADDGFGNTNTIGGVVGGGQLGANWQTGMFVLGIETDIQGTSQDKTFNVLTPAGSSLTVRDSLPWFGTTRGRVGIVADRWLFYVTGGLAYGETRNDVSVLTGPFAGFAASSSQTRTGWAAGGGIEAALADAWSAKLEYLHLDFGNSNVAGFANAKVTEDIVRAGVNYRFGWGGPVRAAY